MLEGVVQRGHHIRRVVVQGPVAQFLAVIGDQACSVKDFQIPPDNVDNVVTAELAGRLGWQAFSDPVHGVVDFQHHRHGRLLEAPDSRAHSNQGDGSHQHGAQRKEKPDHGLIMPASSGPPWAAPERQSKRPVTGEGLV